MADWKSNQTQGSSKVIHLPLLAKRRTRRKPAPEASKAVVLAWDKRVDKEKQEAERLASVLESLAAQVRNREIQGFWFLVDLGEGRHEFGIEGTYDKNPARAYFPSCRAMYHLSEIIQRNGGIDV
ncbi:MAG: hypothetical protein EOP36_00390 [Rubrivivax sp.]|nr:MAG: hypothetical protein EOP36_00390 [Rubrivivax sp.]